MSGMCEERDCSACGVVSFVARRSDAGLCAECQLCRIDDEVVLDALSRAICAVIADAVKDERKSKEAEADSFRVKFNSEGVECSALNRAHGWTGTNCVCVDCVASRVEAKRQTVQHTAGWLDLQAKMRIMPKPNFVSKNKPAMTTEQAMQVAAMRRNAEAANIQPRGHSPEDRFYPSDVPSYTADEVRAAMAPHPDLVRAEKAMAARIEELNAAYPLPGATSTHADDRCARCNSDMSYADPGQTLCYGCRT